mmetsp:Transcript_43336/g.102008  ORF Transcript_43336/g.102008 Transcript_43336/m.102008 type:complete len:1169 (-) Transcript_43336:51-3557(-)
MAAEGTPEVSMDTFLQWREGCLVKKIQAEYRKLQESAKQNGRTTDEEMKKSGHKDFASFAASCPQFNLLCWPEEFAELGSGAVLYFHFLAFLASMLLLLFAVQIPVMGLYATEDWSGYDSWAWIDWQKSFFPDGKNCDCIGTNNGYEMVGIVDTGTYGTTCGAWDLLSSECAAYSVEERPQWCCRSWCFAEEYCAVDQDNTHLSNVRIDANGKTLVAATTECGAPDLSTCGGADVAFTPANPATPKTYDKYFVYLITPGSLGPDQGEDLIIPLLYVVQIGLLVLGCITLYQHFLSMNTKIDLQTTQPNDFAIMASGLPVTATDEAAILKWFKEHAVPGKTDTEIVKVVIGWDFPEFRAKHTKIKELHLKLKGMDPTAPEVKALQQQIAELSKQLQSSAPNSAARLQSSGNVVVIFRYQADLRDCLKRWTSFWARWFYCDAADLSCFGSGNGMWKGAPLPRFPVGDHPVAALKVTRAANPGDINWEEMGKPAQERYLLMLQTNGQMALLVLVSFFVVWGLQRLQIFLEEENFSGASYLALLPALTVGITNIICVQVANRLGVKEFHDTFTSEQLSITLKMTVALIINTSGALFFVNAKPDEWYRNTGLANNVLYILLLTSFIPPLIYLYDPKQRILWWKRRKLTPEKIQEWNAELKGPTPKTAEEKAKRREVNQQIAMFKRIFEPTEIRQPRRYANALKSFVSCVVFMPVLPITPLIGCVAITLQYVVDKYLMLRHYKRPARPSNAYLAKGSLILLKGTTPILLSLSAFCFLTPSFAIKDNLFSLFGICVAATVGVAVTPASILRTLLGLRLVMGRHTYKGSDDDVADYYKVQYGWPKEMKYHKDHFLYKLLPEDKNPEFLTPGSEATKVDELKATYGASAGKAVLAVHGSMASADVPTDVDPSSPSEKPPASSTGSAGAPPVASGTSYGAASAPPTGSAASGGKSYGVPATVYGAPSVASAGGDPVSAPKTYGVVPPSHPTPSFEGPESEREAAASPVEPADPAGPLLGKAAAPAPAPAPVPAPAPAPEPAAAAAPAPAPEPATEPAPAAAADSSADASAAAAAAAAGKGKGKADKDGKGKGKGKGKPRGHWEFETGKGFTAFNADCQDYIERRYQEFVAGSGKSRINVQTAGGDGGGKINISIDFEKMTSKVENSKNIRKIQRKDKE